MTAKQKDLTRAEALALVERQRGDAWVSYGAIQGYRVGFIKYGASEYTTHRIVLGQSAKGWREACEKAGLLESDR